MFLTFLGVHLFMKLKEKLNLYDLVSVMFPIALKFLFYRFLHYQ